MSVSEDLKKAWSLIDHPDRWCQGKNARDGGGCGVEPSSLHAKSFCSQGALMRVLPNYTGNEAPCVFLNRAAETLSGSRDNFIHYNDRHSYPLVKAMWVKAIAMAEEAEKKRTLALAQKKKAKAMHTYLAPEVEVPQGEPVLV